MNNLRKSSDIKDIFRRIRKRDFSGNAGLAVKNSIYQFSTTLVAKMGSLIFIIILARLLMPELFGLYSLALGTIVIFTAFSDLGIGDALVRFVSKGLSKKKPNTKGYYNYLLKIKSVLTFLTSLILISSAYWISHVYYNKPIFFALLAGGLYVFVISFSGFFSCLYYSFNDFKKILIKESIFQTLKLILVPLVVLFSLSFSEEILFLNIFLVISFCYLVGLVFLLIKKPILSGKELDEKEKKEVKKFILPITVTIFSGVFFSYTAMILLGHFVDSEFIGYYSASLTLISSIGALLVFSVVLLPIFSGLGGKRLERGLKKSILIIAPFSLIIIFFTILFAPFIINLIYGVEYSNSIFLLRILALLILSGALSSIYHPYYISKGNTKLIARLFVSIAILNIILNYVLISILVEQSHFMAVVGASIATLISSYVYLGGLILFREK